MKRVAYLALGCDKNRVDAERALGAVAAAGFEVVAAPEAAWAVVVTTCGFIDAAKEESVEAVMEAVRAKERGEYEVVVVTGCLSERYRKELAAEIPEVDLWMGLEHVDRLAEELARMAGSRREGGGQGTGDGEWEIRFGGRNSNLRSSRFLTTPSHYSFLKIAEGCNSACHFCAIPMIRGRLRSAPLDLLVREARELEAAGVKELNLVAQDTTAWGHDFKPRLDLADLVERLLAETGIPWLRVLYAHPNHISERMIGLLAAEDRLCRYLDLPLQHISAKMLKAMGRRPDREGTLALLDRLAARVPELALRTTFLVGFPGESERDFEELLELVEEGRFFWASGFVYSREEGTAAARLSGRVPREAAEERLASLFEAQREVTAGKLAALVGREMTVLVDGPWSEYVEGDEGLVEVRDGGPRWLGRIAGQAAEVDGAVSLEGGVRPGEFARARIVDSWEYDLGAVVVK